MRTHHHIALALALLVSGGAAAQSSAWGEPIEYERPEQVPRWAEPISDDHRPLPFSGGSPSPGPGFPAEPELEDVPIDGGLGLLALAGAGYGAMRLRRRREEE